MREAELHELLLGERDRAYRLALRITGEPESAADAVQEACVSILTATRKGTVGGDVETPRAWFLSAVAHTARHMQKSAKRRRERERKWAVEQSERAAPHAEPAVSREVSEALSLVVGTLEEEFRLPLELHYQEGLSYGEAAAVLRLPKSTVAARVEAALGKLRRMLADRGVNAAPAVVAGGLAAVQLPAAPAALAGVIESLIAGGTASLGKAVAGEAVRTGAGVGAKKAAGLALGWKATKGLALVALGTAAAAAVNYSLSRPKPPVLPGSAVAQANIKYWSGFSKTVAIGETLFEDEFDGTLDKWDVVLSEAGERMPAVGDPAPYAVLVRNDWHIQNSLRPEKALTVDSCLILDTRNEPDRLVAIRSKMPIKADHFLVELVCGQDYSEGANPHRSTTLAGGIEVPQDGIVLSRYKKDSAPFSRPMSTVRWVFTAAGETSEGRLWDRVCFDAGRVLNSVDRVRVNEPRLLFGIRGPGLRLRIDRVVVRKLTKKGEPPARLGEGHPEGPGRE